MDRFGKKIDRRSGRVRRPTSLGLAACAAAWLLVGCGAEQEAPTETAGQTQPALLERGMDLFGDECARCHGPEGRGDGPQAVFLYPKPRDFSQAHFRLTTTAYGLPTDSDLLRSIKNGLPGSTMPPFAHLPDTDQLALVEAVKHLAREGKVQALQTLARARGDVLTTDDARDQTRRLFEPGPLVSVPAELPETAASRARGAELYGVMCVSCHAPASEGGKRDMRDDTGAYLYPRVLESALLARGGSRAELGLTITRGLPGTPMPSYELAGEDLWALVDHVASIGRSEGEDVPAASSGERTITLTGVADPGVWTAEAVEEGYRPPASAAPARIVLVEGEDVVLVLKSADVTHSFYSPQLGIGPVEVYPGMPATFRLKVPAAGEYAYFCMNPCGHCHFSMKGTIQVVAAPAETTVESLDVVCRDIPLVPPEAPAVEKGRVLYQKMSCGECHGERGEGGVQNFNALPTAEVPALNRIVETLLPTITRQSEVDTLLTQVGQGALPDATSRDSLSRQYEAYITTLREGRYTPRRDRSGPEPPLQMPAWEARLTHEEMDAILAYLVSLYEWREPEPVRQVIAFDHSLHVEDAGLLCEDCHANAASSRNAGIPGIAVCQDCHFPEDLEDGEPSDDLRELIAHVERDDDIPWRRVYDLPEHTTFEHRPHVGGANLDCTLCHGDMAALEAPPPTPAFKLRMSWCVDCHRQNQATEDCRSCHR